MPDKIAALRIEGRVQGVGYRHWMVEAARSRGLRGWVRNRSEGWVEALVAGPAEAVDALVADCHRGPASAAVERVDVHEPDEASTAGMAAATHFVARGTR